MKARTIRKLRKIVAKYNEFIVNLSNEKLGALLFNANGSNFKCKAKDELHAIRKFFRWYERRYKERHEFWFWWSQDEKCKVFAKFQVVDKKGFKKYY